MKSLVRLLGLVLAIMFTIGSAAQAQTLAAGTWTGSIIDPGGDEAPVTYEVGGTGDSLHISMTVAVPDGPPAFVFTNIHFDQGKLLFTWSANIDINCSLDPADAGSYSGTCTDSEGKSGQIKMVPPKNG